MRKKIFNTSQIGEMLEQSPELKDWYLMLVNWYREQFLSNIPFTRIFREKVWNIFVSTVLSKMRMLREGVRFHV